MVEPSINMYQLYGCQMLPTFSKQIPVIEVASHVKGQHIVGKVLSVETWFCWFGQFDFCHLDITFTFRSFRTGHLLRTVFWVSFANPRNPLELSAK